MTTDHDREETYGRVLTGLRWDAGKLQVCYAEKYSRYEGRRLISSGTREIWEDVAGEPGPVGQVSQPTEAGH